MWCGVLSVLSSALVGSKEFFLVLLLSRGSAKWTPGPGVVARPLSWSLTSRVLFTSLELVERGEKQRENSPRMSCRRFSLTYPAVSSKPGPLCLTKALYAPLQFLTNVLLVKACSHALAPRGSDWLHARPAARLERLTAPRQALLFCPVSPIAITARSRRESPPALPTTTPSILEGQ